MKEIVASQDLRIGMFVCELDRPWLGSPFVLQGFLVDDDDTLAKLRDVCRFVYVDRARSTGEAWRPEPVEDAGAEARERVASLSSFQTAPAARRRPPDFFALLRSVRGEKENAGGAGGARSPFVHRYPDAVRGPVSRVSESEPDEPVSRAGNRPFITYSETATPTRPGKGDVREPGNDSRGGSGAAGMVYTQLVPVEEEILAALPVVDRAQTLLEEIARDVQSSLNPDLERLRMVVGDMVVSVARNPDALLWLLRLKQTDQYSYDHSLDVAAHVMIFGRYLGLGDDTITTLGMAGMLQDVGKLRLPVRLLQKVGPISRREYEIFKTHVDFSLQILAGTPHASPLLLEIVGRHHERCDGSGYPGALQGEQIGLPAEIAGICDVYCAMTRDRPCGEAATAQAALESVRVMRGHGFSESTVDQFIQCIGIYPVGTLVEMNSGEVAVVIAQNRIRRLKPRVMMLLGPDKLPNSYPHTVDLIYDPPNAAGQTYAILKALPPGAFGIEPSEYYLA